MDPLRTCLDNLKTKDGSDQNTFLMAAIEFLKVGPFSQNKMQINLQIQNGISQR